MFRLEKNTFNYILSKIYGGITQLRNFLFDKNILHSQSFAMPIISIGNLAIGGTGKTPHTEFILKNLSNNYNVAILSRGYKRKTKGFVLADQQSTASTIGDEPYQLFTNNPDITIAVDENRVRGIQKLMKLNPRIDVIILDDSYQHRYVKAGLNILLTEHNNLFSEDDLMPYGKLREDKKNSERADIVIVTKCKNEPNEKEQKKIKKSLKIEENHQKLFFSRFDYEKIYPVFDEEVEKIELTNRTNVLLLTGIENPRPLYRYLNETVNSVNSFNYPDHYQFTTKDIRKIEAAFYKMEKDKVIITTEKDASRIKAIKKLSTTFQQNLFAIPITTKILYNEQEKFIQKINNYVRKNQRNS